MSFSAEDIAILKHNIASLIARDACEWFFDFEADKWACLIGTDVLLFTREADDSIGMQYQNRRLLLLRDTGGWSMVSEKLRGFEGKSPDDLPHGDRAFEEHQAKIRMRVLEAFAGRVAALASA